MADDFHNLDKISQKNLFSYSLNLFRETLLNISVATGINRTRGEELKFVQDFSKVLDWKKIETGTKLINEAIYHLERNGSAKMIFLDLSIQLHKTFQPK
jgi:DNA polymerase-3 subunit delta'